MKKGVQMLLRSDKIFISISFILLILFFSQISFAGVLIITDENCPKNITCPMGELLGDDGQCYKCNDKRAISILCNINSAKEACPNRYLSPYGEFTNIHKSVIQCPENLVLENGICREKECEDFEGFHSTKDGCCPINEDGQLKYDNGVYYKIKILDNGEKIKEIHPCFRLIRIG